MLQSSITIHFKNIIPTEILFCPQHLHWSSSHSLMPFLVVPLLALSTVREQSYTSLAASKPAGVMLGPSTQGFWCWRFEHLCFSRFTGHSDTVTWLEPIDRSRLCLQVWVWGLSFLIVILSRMNLTLAIPGWNPLWNIKAIEYNAISSIHLGTIHPHCLFRKTSCIWIIRL